MQIVVLDTATLGLPDESWDALAEFGDVELYARTPYEDAVIAERCAKASVVLTNKVPLSAEVFAQCPSIELVSVLATGYNVIDIEAARTHGVTVCNVPAYSTESVAQHTLALMLELTNRVGLHDFSVHRGDWCRSEEFAYWLTPMVELGEHTVGVVGVGMIGQRVAQMVCGFGGKVLGYSRRRRYPLRQENFAWADMEEIFERADVISLHCPQTPENAGFVNAELIARMKPGAFLINTARGGLINEHDLAVALHEGRLGGAALDVVSEEPMREDNPLLGAPNCIITPHMAWASLPSRERLLRNTLGNLRGYQNDHPVNVVRG